MLPKIAEQAAKILPSSFNLANKVWLKSLTDPRDVFKTLRLGEASLTRLDDNPKFLQWLKYVTMYRAKREGPWFTDISALNLLRTTTPDAELVVLLQSIKLVSNMKKSAETMQRYVLETSAPAIHRWMHEVWLRGGETPQSVFNILPKDSPVFLQWLRFTERYKVKLRETSYSDRQTLKILLETRQHAPEIKLASFFPVT